MSLRPIATEWKYVSSYATEANLNKAIEKIAADYPEHNDRFVVVRTPEGRWTAIVKLDMSKGGYLGRYEGFMKM
jgi:hypothetical protein